MPYRPKASRNWHYDFQIGGRRFCGSCGTEDYETAKAVEAAARVAAKAAPEARGNFTLSEALGTYLSDIALHQPSYRTACSQAKALLAILKPGTRISAITNADVMRFVTTRRATVSNATVNRQLQLLGRALRHMGKYHGAAVPALDLKAAETREPEERVRELTAGEQARLLKALRVDLHPMVKFALMTGARVETIAGLRWADVDLDGGRLLFRIKGGGRQVFPVNGELRAFLSALPRAEALPHREFVITFVDGQTAERKRIRASGGSLFEDFRKALAAAGIADFRFHDLRHTFATRLLRLTGNLKLVSRLLGHRSIETTMRYAHVLDGDLRDAMAGYEALGKAAGRRKSGRDTG